MKCLVFFLILALGLAMVGEATKPDDSEKLKNQMTGR